MVVAQKSIRPSWEARKVTKHKCIICGARLNCPGNEEDCEFACHNFGGPSQCGILVCNAHWYDHNQRDHYEESTV